MGKLEDTIKTPFKRRRFNFATAKTAAVLSLAPNVLLPKVPIFDNTTNTQIMSGLYQAAGFGVDSSSPAALELGIRLAKIGCDPTVPVEAGLKYAQQCAQALAKSSNLPSLVDFYKSVREITATESTEIDLNEPTRRRLQLLHSIGSRPKGSDKIDYYFDQLRHADKLASL